jgi:hypothetical protein
MATYHLHIFQVQGFPTKTRGLQKEPKKSATLAMKPTAFRDAQKSGAFVSATKISAAPIEGWTHEKSAGMPPTPGAIPVVRTKGTLPAKTGAGTNAFPAGTDESGK